MADYLALNAGGHVLLNAGGAILLNADSSVPAMLGGGHDDDLTARVRFHWDNIERIRAENREREAAEAERTRHLEARRQDLAELEAQRTRRRKAAQQAQESERAAILADIAAIEEQRVALHDQIAAALRRIEAELAAIALMKRRALLLVALAS